MDRALKTGLRQIIAANPGTPLAEQAKAVLQGSQSVRDFYRSEALAPSMEKINSELKRDIDALSDDEREAFRRGETPA